jgi:hypothetical protein
MKLTETQIEQLYKFTRQHFVYHYDVQTELVDHLANDIEQTWEENPKLSFEQTRDVSFKKFGVFGFMDVLEQKQKAMNKHYGKILWRFTKEWFTFPKIVTTAVIFMLFFIVLQQKHSILFLGTCFFILAAYEFFNFFRQKLKNKVKQKRKIEKRWLLKEMIGETRAGFSFFSFLNAFNIINLLDIDFYTLPTYGIAIVAFLATLSSITFYITAFVMPSKAEELLTEKYPEYSMV